MATVIEAAIFDMDGLLVDSEPLWKQAEIKVFAGLGVKLNDEMCHETEGFRLDEAVNHWYTRFPWQGTSPEKVERAILLEVSRLIAASGSAMDGVYETLNLCRKQGLKLGLASSSPMSLIEAVVDKLEIRPYFQVLWSAQYEARGKPDPAVYLSTAEKLNVSPNTCIAFEDSYNGLLAARGAGMYTVGVPYHSLSHLPKFDIADLKLSSLTEFSEGMLLSLLQGAERT